jgi:D-alanyl-D-alanine dipeptidase
MKAMKIQFLSIAFFTLGLLASCRESNVNASQPNSVAENDNIAISNAKQPELQTVNTDIKLVQVEIDGKQSELVLAKEVVPNLVEDLKYATTDNFMHRKLYTDPKCYLLKETAQKLSLADKALSERKPGFRLKVWDCYRPMTIQQEMWKEYTNTPYVANPKTARHPRGRAVDITIVDVSGNEVEMPTKFDDFTPKAHPNAPTTAKAATNRELLRSVMTSVGLKGVNSEWWHFDNWALPPNVAGSDRDLTNLFSIVLEQSRQPNYHFSDTVFVSISGFIYELSTGKLVKGAESPPKRCGNLVNVGHSSLDKDMIAQAEGASLWEFEKGKWTQIAADESIGYPYDELLKEGVSKSQLKCLGITPL